MLAVHSIKGQLLWIFYMKIWTSIFMEMQQKSNVERAVTTFLDIVNCDMETLKIRSIVKDSSFFKYITHKSDGHIYHTKKECSYGKKCL